MTDQEINEAVARKLGYRKLFDGPSVPDKQIGWGTPDYDGLKGTGKWMLGPPDYCHSIEAAWEIVEFVRVKGLASEYAFQLDCYESGKCASGWYNANGNLAWEKADTAPMAICLALLKCP